MAVFQKKNCLYLNRQQEGFSLRAIVCQSLHDSLVLMSFPQENNKYDISVPGDTLLWWCSQFLPTPRTPALEESLPHRRWARPRDLLWPMGWRWIVHRDLKGVSRMVLVLSYCSWISASTIRWIHPGQCAEDMWSTIPTAQPRGRVRQAATARCMSEAMEDQPAPRQPTRWLESHETTGKKPAEEPPSWAQSKSLTHRIIR